MLKNYIAKLNSLNHLQKEMIILIDFTQKEVHIFDRQDLITQKISISIHGKEIGYIHNSNFNKVELTISDKSVLNYLQNPCLKNIPESYRTSYNYVQQQLQLGNSYLVNLTQKTPIHITGSLAAIYQQVSANYKVCWPNRFCCYSPETFIQISNNMISTFPMKGTILASSIQEIEPAKQTLLNDDKENQEHITVVDLLRNDLSICANNTRVDSFKNLDTIKLQDGSYLIQMSSKISADLEDDWPDKLGDILQDLLVAGSISGAPKSQTLEIISQAEQSDRGFYTGIVAYYQPATESHPASLDSGVLIRFISQEKDNFFFHSGGGITINSNLEQEWQETISKIYLSH